MERLNEVLIAFNKGQMKIEDIAWLIETVEAVTEGFKGQFELASQLGKENTELREEIKRLQVIEQAYNGMRLAK